MSTWFLDSKLSTCFTIDFPAQLVSIFENKICHGENFENFSHSKISGYILYSSTVTRQ